MNDSLHAQPPTPTRLQCMWWRIIDLPILLLYALNDRHADKDYGADWLGKLYWYPPIALRRCAGYPSRFLCRWRGHPKGVWWYNTGGMEPDMRCKGCGENLG